MAKDYYKILGVNKTDSAETIKKAYRDAVKRLHPDVSGGEFDKKRFYEIQEAYETLGDEEKRKVYDRDRSRERGLKHGTRRRSDDFSHFSASFEDLFTWLERGFPFSRQRPEPDEITQHRVEITLSVEEALSGGEIDLEVPSEGPCPFCGGRGEKGFFSCPVCGGTGRKMDYSPVRVSIPPGVEDGTILRVPFAGGDGRRHTLLVFIQVDWFE